MAYMIRYSIANGVRYDLASEESESIPLKGTTTLVKVDGLTKEIIVRERFGLSTEESGLTVIQIYAHYPNEMN